MCRYYTLKKWQQLKITNMNKEFIPDEKWQPMSQIKWQYDMKMTCNLPTLTERLQRARREIANLEKYECFDCAKLFFDFNDAILH